jgi:hypothetical protein
VSARNHPGIDEAPNQDERSGLSVEYASRGPRSAGAASDWQVEVDRCTPTEWAQMLDIFADANLYQTHAYGTVRWGEENLSHIVLRRDGEVVAMAQLRVLRPAPVPFGVAYLRWGPLFRRIGYFLDAEAVSQMGDALQQEYVIRRKLLLRVIPHVASGSAEAAILQAGLRRFQSDSWASGDSECTFLLDLSSPLDELRRQLDKKWRNQLTNAEKRGLSIVSGTGSKEYAVFRTLYRQMRQRKTFETTVDVEEFGRIQEALPERHRLRIMIAYEGEIAIAGLVASAMGDTGIYLLGATGDAGLNAKGAYLLQWSLIAWLKEKGCTRYDLGGIDPASNPGVYHFKKGLSGADVTYLPPLMACRNALSCRLMKAGLAIRRRTRDYTGRLRARSGIGF